MIEVILSVVFWIAIAIIGVFLLAWIMSPKPALPLNYIELNPLKKYTPPTGWEGVPVDKKGRYNNEKKFIFYQNYVDVLRWFPSNLINICRNPIRDTSITEPTSDDFLRGPDCLMWLGHASFFLRLNETNLLIDPQFNNTSFYKRHTKPVPIHLFKSIDYILISHDHFDHCDKKSLQIIFENNPSAIVLTGLGMESLIKSFSPKQRIIYTAEWYEQFPIKDGRIKVHFVPSRHYCHRRRQDFNRRLWGGFIINYPSREKITKTVFFGGDLGYADHFSDIKTLFKPDIAILGIGAYAPQWFMHPNHMSPKDAVQAYKDIGARSLIPMHYKTFNLSSENMKCPLNELNKYKNSVRGIKILDVGEILLCSGANNEDY